MLCAQNVLGVFCFLWGWSPALWWCLLPWQIPGLRTSVPPTWHHPWGNSKMVESGTPGLFCGKLFKLKLCPQRLPFWHSRLQAQLMCNKIKTLKCLSCTHIQACMCTEGPARGYTDMVNSCLGQELGQTWERQLLSYPKHFFLPQLCTLSFLTLIRGCC